MKLKALARLCAEAKQVILYETPEGMQWAGTGSVIWKLPENLGRLNTAALCAIFDITAEKAAKMKIKSEMLPEGIDTDDQVPGEKDLLYWLGRRLVLDGEDVLPLNAPGGEVFLIQTRSITPGKDAEQPGLCLRKTPGGTPYIAVKDGIFLQAIIVPIHIAPELATWLGDVTSGITLL